MSILGMFHFLSCPRMLANDVPSLLWKEFWIIYFIFNSILRSKAVCCAYQMLVLSVVVVAEVFLMSVLLRIS